MAEPIKITLYDENDEVKAEFSRSTIPWGILKKALKLQSIDKKGVSDADLDKISGLVCEIFGNKITLDDIDKYVDVEEVMAVFAAVISRASSMSSGSIPNAMAGK